MGFVGREAGEMIGGGCNWLGGWEGIDQDWSVFRWPLAVGVTAFHIYTHTQNHICIDAHTFASSLMWLE